MSEVVVTAVVTPQEGRLDDLVEAFTAHTAAVHAEDGCLLYAVHRSDDALVVIERWASPEALAAHGSGSAMKELGGALAGLVAGRSQVTRLTAVPSGDPAKGAL